MEDRQFTWAKTPGGYRVVILDRNDPSRLDFGGTQTTSNGMFTMIMPNIEECPVIWTLGS